MVRLAFRTLFPKAFRGNERASTARRKPSRRLLAAAISGLLSLSAGCDEGSAARSEQAGGNTSAAWGLGSGADAGAQDAATPDAFYNITVSQTGQISLADFTKACDERRGLVQTSATCAGINACRGFSTNGVHLIEHSCKGLSGCGPGMSCVILPPDGNKSGKDIYEEQLPITAEWGCGSTCHGQFDPTYDLNHFTLYLRPNTVTPQEALQRFRTGPRDRLMSIIAFGSSGLNDNGTAYSTMSGYHSYYSAAEMDRLIDYIRTLPVAVKVYGIPGLADGGATDVGAPGVPADGGVPDLSHPLISSRTPAETRAAV